MLKHVFELFWMVSDRFENASFCFVLFKLFSIFGNIFMSKNLCSRLSVSHHTLNQISNFSEIKLANFFKLPKTIENYSKGFKNMFLYVFEFYFTILCHLGLFLIDFRIFTV